MKKKKDSVAWEEKLFKLPLRLHFRHLLLWNNPNNHCPSHFTLGCNKSPQTPFTNHFLLWSGQCPKHESFWKALVPLRAVWILSRLEPEDLHKGHCICPIFLPVILSAILISALPSNCKGLEPLGAEFPWQLSSGRLWWSSVTKSLPVC